MSSARRTVEVCADYDGLPGPTSMGLLHATPARGKEVLSFEYDPAWLLAGHTQDLDPALRLHRGPQYAARENFGLFLDSSPDRWGRVLLQRREAQLAREHGRRERRLSELDYLLGVYDGHRMGGLRFRIGRDGPFLDDNRDLASPPWASLRDIENASLALEGDDAERAPEYEKWLRMLIAPGRSLGGARPKASVIDEEQRLWIAKFPSREDTDDVGAWESVLHALARQAGVSTPETKRQRFGSRHHTFLTRRFDRTPEGRRLHFASAMTWLDRSDGESGSYLELAEILIQQGSHPTRDLQQLWRRIVFFVCVSNVDDHLRNHGFMLDPPGWSLAPAYDLNPNPDGDGLSLNISETDNAQNLDLLRDVAEYFRVKPRRAAKIIGEVRKAVRRWRVEAAAAGLGRGAQDRMESAFRLAETR